MSKYIIEIAEEYEEYFKGVLICGIADGKFAVDVIAREDLEELNSDYINEHYGELQDEAYQAGLNDAWEAAKKIFGHEIDGGLDIDELKKAFGSDVYCTADIIRTNTAEQAIAKLKAYEDKHSDRIEVGDEVISDTGTKFIVTAFTTSDSVCGFSERGLGCFNTIDKLKKTGKHYDIQSILEAMKS